MGMNRPPPTPEGPPSFLPASLVPVCRETAHAGAGYRPYTTPSRIADTPASRARR